MQHGSPESVDLAFVRAARQDLHSRQIAADLARDEFQMKLVREAIFPTEPGKTVGVGLEPGDAYYDEPYFYVTASPRPPAAAATAPLAGDGSWHTHEWVGAVLPGSRLRPAQIESQPSAFLDSGIAACRQLVGG